MGYTGNQLQTHAIVAKAGVDALAVQCAIELGPRGITSNVIAPGPVAGTEGVDRLYPEGENAEASKAIPSGRLGRVKDIADATVFLFSDAGNWVNGATLVGKCGGPQTTIIADLLKSMEERGECMVRALLTMSHIQSSSYRRMRLPESSRSF